MQIELIDVFPHDHPALDSEPEHTPEGGGATSDQIDKKEMSSTLNALVKNNLQGKFGIPPGDDSIMAKIHGYIYVYDASNKNTFDTLSCLIDTIREIETSELRGKKGIFYKPKKFIFANKIDLITRSTTIVDRDSLKKLEINKHLLVSAFTNHGVQEAFRALINDIHSCSILHNKLQIYHDEEIKKKDEGDEFDDSLRTTIRKP